METGECIFCKIVRKQIPAEMVWEADAVVAFKDIHPKAEIHLLIVPKKHLATLRDLSEDDRFLVGEIVRAANQIMSEAHLGRKDYRLIANCGKGAGQAVFHVHFHLLAGRMFHFG